MNIFWFLLNGYDMSCKMEWNACMMMNDYFKSFPKGIYFVSVHFHSSSTEYGSFGSYVAVAIKGVKLVKYKTK